MIKTMHVDDYRVTVHLWKKAGEARFHSLTRAFLVGTDAVALVFDLTRRSSFRSLLYWKDQLEEKGPKGFFPIIVIGNKADRWEEAEVSEQEARLFSQKNGMEFFATSATEGFEGTVRNALDWLVDAHLLEAIGKNIKADRNA